MNNRALLDHLLDAGEIALQQEELLATAPAPLREAGDSPSGPLDTFSRIEGMLLGLAVGDALGNTTESLLPDERRRRHGEVRDYLPNRHAGSRPVGLPSDDTQLAFWTLEQMLADGGLDPERVAARFCHEPIFGIGSAVREFVANYRAGLPWYRCGARSAGNGALMRIAPVLLPHLRSGTAALWADTALLAALTHNDPASTSACLAFVGMLWQLLQMDCVPHPSWWPETYVALARDLEGETTYRPRSGPLSGYAGPLWRFVGEQVPAAYRQGLTVLEAANRWHSGAYLLETLPCVLYLLMRHAGEPEEAIVRAVNDTKDNDTVAAIAGAALGALHGRAALPARWLAGLSGRTATADDGQVGELIAAARERWWMRKDALSRQPPPGVRDRTT